MDSLDYRQLGYIALLTVLLTSGFWTFIFSTLKFCICFYLRFLIVHVVLLLVRPEFRKYFVGMEAKAKEVLAVLKNSNLSLDAKVNQILGLKSDIKQKNVPSAATDALFECLRLAIASPHYQLLAAGFSMLGHLIKRLFVQNEHHVVAAKARELYSTLVERMGDHKERFRAHAAQAFTDLWPADGPEVEHQVLQVALTGKNPRAKESCLVWLVDMAHQRDMLFRQYVPNVIACLEEADAHVRETAKATVIALFKNAPSHAQLDLKRQLAPVRKTIANAILSGIGLEEDLSVTRPPSRGEALRRPPSRGEALRRPPSRGEALRRPPSRGDALHQRPATVEPQRPPSRGDALHQRSATVEPQRPPSRGDALHQRPAAAESQQHPSSRGDVLHQRPTSVETQRPPSRGDALYQRSATVETQRPPSRGDALHQRPAASESQQHASSRGDVLHQRPLMVETQRPPSRGVALSQPTDSALYVPEEQTVELYEKDTPAIVRPTPVRPNNNTSGHETAPRAAASAERLSVPPPPRYPLKASEMVEPRDLFSAREFEEIYTGMLDCFQGKEEENNWTHREKSVKMLRRITHGNAPHDFPEAFMQGIKILLDGISKVALSLRTSMTTNGLLLIRDLACVCQSQLDPVIDIILQVCLKVCVNQKRIAADRGDITVTTLLENLTCNTRLLSHITTAALGNSPQLRGYSAGWITVILEHQSRHKTTPEGAKSIAEVIKVNLSYASAEVRQNYRATFWAFYHAWQTRASKLLNDLDPKVRALVEKDPHNPAKDPFVTTATPSKAGPTRPTLKGKGTKTSLAAAKRRPPLPKAEQTALPDATSINHHEQPISKPTATAPQNTSSLTSAPMRPGVAKPRPPPLDLARPATATGFRQMVAESPIQSTPTRIPAPSPSKKVPGSSFRPRQKSDPLQDASPTKIRHGTVDKRASLERPYGTITLPKKRSKDGHAPLAGGMMIRPAPPIMPPLAPLVRAPAALPVEAPGISSIEASLGEQGGVPVALPVDPPVAPLVQVSPNASSFEEPSALPAERPSVSPIEASLGEQDGVPVALPVDPPVAPLVQVSPNASSFEEPSELPAEHPGVSPIKASVGEQGGVPETLPVDHSLAPSVEARFAARNVSPLGSPAPAIKPAGVSTGPWREYSSRWTRIETPPKRRKISPRSQDPILARAMLAKGIEQVRTKKMDILGYRKLQALIDFHGNIFDDVEQFDHTLKVLLDELQAPVPQEEAQKPASPAWDLKTQVLCTVQFMFDRAKSHFAGYYPNTIVALLKADKVCEAAPHLSEVIGNLIDDILAEAELVELAYTIVKVIDFKDSDTEFRLFLHGMDVLGRIVGRLNERKMSLPDDTTESIAELSARALKKDGLGHQKAVIVTCVELRKMIASDGRLFTLMRNPDEQTRQLIMYYKMRETVY